MKFSIGDKVSLIKSPPYLKTADSMPMLRPPDLVSIDEIGEVISIESIESVSVRFRRGHFLVSNENLKFIS